MDKVTKRVLTTCLSGVLTGCCLGGITVGLIRGTHSPNSDSFTSEPFVEVATFEEISTEEVTSEEITDVVETTTAEAKIENIYYDCPLSHDLQDYIRELCNERGIPMSLVIAIIDVESSFNPDAISSTDDFGLMQINRCNLEWLRTKGVTDIFDPYQNVYAGILILSQCYNGNVSKALMEYNLGAGGASELWSKGVYSTNYSRTVLAAKEVYDEQV